MTRSLYTGILTLGLFISFLVPSAFANTAKVNPPKSCKVFFTVVEQDALHNINEGLIAVGFSKKRAVKWLEKMHKKYPDVCYVNPDTTEGVVFFVSATPATYHGTRVITESHPTSSSTSGTITDDNGNSADYSGTTSGTSYSSTAIPYSVDYNYYTLTILRREPGDHFKPLRRFAIKGLYHEVYGFKWGKGKHPIANVMEEAITWIHDGGLNNKYNSITP